MRIFKRWREVPEQAEFEVVNVPHDQDVAQEAAHALLSDDPRPEREKGQHPGVRSLEGDSWTVHAADGVVYLSGEDGIVQAQFAPVDAYSLGTLLHQAAQD